jgi:hypothetical protein
MFLLERCIESNELAPGNRVKALVSLNYCSSYQESGPSYLLLEQTYCFASLQTTIQLSELFLFPLVTV